MSKTIIVKLTKAGTRTGPRFNISDDRGRVIDTDVLKSKLKKGVAYIIEDDVKVVILESTDGCLGTCAKKIYIPVTTLDTAQIAAIQTQNTNTASLWRHLTSAVLYNNYYGKIEPYVIEYPFSYQFQDEILQNVKDYTKAYKYFQGTDGIWNNNDRIETDNFWFNKAILYNNQQSSGILELVPKPLNNMREYLKYPIYKNDSKIINYTKSDNFYQYNTFWALNKDKSLPLFTIDCCSSMSIDKVVNQPNMDYGKRSFKKAPLRAKDLKVRHILDNRSDVSLVSQFLVTPSQISYK